MFGNSDVRCSLLEPVKSSDTPGRSIVFEDMRATRSVRSAINAWPMLEKKHWAGDQTFPMPNDLILFAVNRLTQGVQTHHFGLGHFLIGKAHPFPAEAAVLGAAKRHRIETIVGRVVDHHATRVDPPRRTHRRRQV